MNGGKKEGKKGTVIAKGLILLQSFVLSFIDEKKVGLMDLQRKRTHLMEGEESDRDPEK